MLGIAAGPNAASTAPCTAPLPRRDGHVPGTHRSCRPTPGEGSNTPEQLPCTSLTQLPSVIPFFISPLFHPERKKSSRRWHRLRHGAEVCPAKGFLKDGGRNTDPGWGDGVQRTSKLCPTGWVTPSHQPLRLPPWRCLLGAYLPARRRSLRVQRWQPGPGRAACGPRPKTTSGRGRL